MTSKRYKLKIVWTDSYNNTEEHVISEAVKNAIDYAPGDKALSVLTEDGLFRIFDPKAQIRRIFIKEIVPPLTSVSENYRKDIAPEVTEITLPKDVQLPENLSDVKAEKKFFPFQPTLTPQSDAYKRVVETHFNNIRKHLSDGNPQAAMAMLENINMKPRLQATEPVVYSFLYIETAVKVGRIADAKAAVSELKEKHADMSKASKVVELETMIATADLKALPVVVPSVHSLPSK